MEKIGTKILVVLMTLSLSFCEIFVFNIEQVKASSEIVDVYVDGSINYLVSQEMLRLVNEARKKQGLNQLKMDKSLTDAAMTRSMELSIYISDNHIRPNGKDRASLNSKIVWENTCEASGIYQYFYESDKKYAKRVAEDMFEALMDSAHHREGILKSGFKSIGIGAFFNGDGNVYVSQEFSKSSMNKKCKATKVKSVVKKIATKKEYLTKNYTKVIACYNYNNSKKIKVGKKTKVYVQHKNPYDKSLMTHLNNKSFKFKSSNKKIAIVNSKGVIKGLKPGKVTITIKVKNCSEIKYKLKIKVIE